MAKLVDITGQTFGDLTVIEYAGDRKWKCKCSCGKEIIALGNGLRRGTTHSCGHDNPKLYKDITGMKFGDWEVIEPDRQGYWKCRCSCGTIKSVAGWHLRSGRSKSCGHSKTGFASNGFKETKTFDDENYIFEGAVINEWTVLYRVDTRYVRCRCSCGNERDVSIWALKVGRSKSCGECSFEDLTDKQFGDWKVLEYCGNSAWKCECSCGEIKTVNRRDLISGKSKSCGGSIHRLKYDLVGQKFGMLTAIRYTENGRYECICECGAIKEIRTCNLLNGSTVSCGCKNAVILTPDVLRSIIVNLKYTLGEKPTLQNLADTTGYNKGYISSLVIDYGLRDEIQLKSNKSTYETEIFNFIHELNPELDIIQGYKLSGIEIDIYIPSKQLGIEFNGDYWHSSLFKNSNYHRYKTDACKQHGIRLIHIFEYEWNDKIKHTKLKNFIAGIVNNVDKLYARNCEVREVDTDDASKFLDQHHLQGSIGAEIKIGLYHNNRLIAVMTFGKPRFNKDDTVDYELLRYCVDNNIKIVGGGHKLFKYFVTRYNPNKVITYSDKSKFTGDIYIRLGFDNCGDTEPSYVWVKGNEVLSRYQTQKHKLIENGLADESDTEDTAMTKLGYLKIYSCGNSKFMYDGGQH